MNRNLETSKSLLALIGCLCQLTITMPARSAEITWIGGTGDWEDADNWDPNQVPAEDDTAFVNSGNAIINENTSVVAFTLSGGQLSGSGTLTINDAMSWTGGILSGTGQTIIGADATLMVTGSASKTQRSRTLTLLGPTTFEGTGHWNAGQGAVVNNDVLFDIKNDADLLTNNIGGAAPVFHNRGTLHKTAGSGVTRLGAAFNNSATFAVLSGTVELNGGGTGSGTFTVTGGESRIQFSNATYNLAEGSQVRGDGVIEFVSGRVNIDGSYDVSTTRIIGGNAFFNLAAQTDTLMQSNGSQDGSAALTVITAMNWTGGILSGTGQTIIGADARLMVTGSASKTLRSRTLTLLGPTTFEGTGDWNAGQGAVVNNDVLFDIKNDADLLTNNVGGAAPVFHNRGTILKLNSAGTTRFGADLLNDGRVELVDSTWQQLGSVDNNGPGTLAGTGTFDFDSQAFTAAGDIAPGNSSGVLTITGNLPHQNTSNIHIEIGGQSPGAGYDQLILTGHAVLLV